MSNAHDMLPLNAGTPEKVNAYAATLRVDQPTRLTLKILAPWKKKLPFHAGVLRFPVHRSCGKLVRMLRSQEPLWPCRHAQLPSPFTS